MNVDKEFKSDFFFFFLGGGGGVEGGKGLGVEGVESWGEWVSTA